MPVVTFVGTGEAFDPDLPNTSVLYEGARNLLLDCGYSVPHALWRVTRDPDLLDAVFISHEHADHAFGTPALIAWMREAGRKKPLDVFGGSGIEDWLHRLVELGYPGTYAREGGFVLRPRELRPGGFVDYGPIRIRTAQSRHDVPNLAVRLEEGTTSVCYSGDGAPNSSTKRLYDGATVLVHECRSGAEHAPNHARVDEVLEIHRAQGVQTLCLVHLGCDDKPVIMSRIAGRRGLLVPRPGDQLFVGSAELVSAGEVV